MGDASNDQLALLLAYAGDDCGWRQIVNRIEQSRPVNVRDFTRERRLLLVLVAVGQDVLGAGADDLGVPARPVIGRGSIQGVLE